MSEFMVKINSKYSKYRDRNGTVTVLLKKALYGCVQSAALWYGNFGKTLKKLGYVRNETDICVYNKVGTDGAQCTLCIYVDDLLITSTSKRMISELTEGLRMRCGEITLKYGPAKLLRNVFRFLSEYRYYGAAWVSRDRWTERVRWERC
jgi:Reverse transcriptase (RNA-dependent DNA polymerase)